METGGMLLHYKYGSAWSCHCRQMDVEQAFPLLWDLATCTWGSLHPSRIVDAAWNCWKLELAGIAKKTCRSQLHCWMVVVVGDCAGKAPYEPSYGQGYFLVFSCIIILMITWSAWYYFARMVNVNQFWSKQPYVVCHENIFRYIVCGQLIREERTNVSISTSVKEFTSLESGQDSCSQKSILLSPGPFNYETGMLI